MTSAQAAKVVRNFIEREQTMRERVFRHSHQFDAKVGDCKAALAALDVLPASARCAHTL